MTTADKPTAYYESVFFEAYEVLNEDATDTATAWTAVCFNVDHPVLGHECVVRTSRLVSEPNPDGFETRNTKYVRR